MTIVLPFTKIKPGVRKALKATGRNWEEIDVSESDEAYWELISSLWREAQDFAVVEHDVIVRPDTFDEFENCQGDWCAFQIPYLHGYYPGMGCVRFRAGLMRAYPSLLDQVAAMSNEKHPRRHWCVVDGFMRFILTERLMVSQCVHQPPVGHYRTYKTHPQPSHGCCSA